MHDKLREFERASGLEIYGLGQDGVKWKSVVEKFAQMIVKECLDEVDERAYVSGDRVWSNEIDRKWVELAFGFGKLAKSKNERTN